MGASLPTQIKACFNAMETAQFTFSFSQKFRVMPSPGKVTLTVFWDSLGVLLAHFQMHGENVNSATYCELLVKLRDAICGKRSGQLARGVLLHHDNATWKEMEGISLGLISVLSGTSWKGVKNHLSQYISSSGQDVNSGCQKDTIEALPT
jgi:hypothetical protein